MRSRISRLTHWIRAAFVASLLTPLVLGSAVQAQPYRLAYLPLDATTDQQLSSDAFRLDPMQANKPVFDASILQGLGNDGYLFALEDPLSVSGTYYFEGRVGQSENGLSLSLANAEIDVATFQSFAQRLDQKLAAGDHTGNGLVVLNLVQGEASAISALHLLANELNEGLNTLPVVILLSADAPSDAFATGAATMRRIIHGYADRPPFGNSDSQVTRDEIQSYLLRMSELKGDLLYARIAGPDDQAVVTINPNVPRDARDAIDYQRELAEVQFSIIMEDASALASYLQTCEFCPELEQAQTVSSKLQESDARLMAETQLVKRVIKAEKVEALDAYLKTCEICPRRTEAESLLFALQQNQARSDEQSEWESAKRYRDTVKITRYLTSCRFCENQVEAVALRNQLLIEEEDQSRWDEARAQGSQDALRNYIANCQACGFKPAAQIQLDELISAERRAKELQGFQTAFDQNDFKALRNYRDTCEFCAEKSTALAKLDALRAKMKDQIDGMMGDCRLVAPRIKSRGLVLNAEDLAKAAETCQTVHDLDPTFNEATTLLARALIAQGQLDTARKLMADTRFDDYPHGYSVQAWLTLRGPESDANFQSAVEALEAAEALDDPFAALHLSGLILSGKLDGKGPADAFQLLEKTANLGNAYSQTTLGWMYENGSGTEANTEQAATWYQAAANQGEGTALGYLASLYETGNGVARSNGAAADLYMQALDRGSSWVANRLTNQWQDRDPELLKAVQVKLQERGLYEGDIDGLFGPGTNAAINGLQQSKTLTAYPLLGIELKP